MEEKSLALAAGVELVMLGREILYCRSTVCCEGAAADGGNVAQDGYTLRGAVPATCLHVFWEDGRDLVNEVIRILIGVMSSCSPGHFSSSSSC